MLEFLIKKASSQFKKPSGLLGKLVIPYMQKRNEPVYQKFISLIDLKYDSKALEIGYGTGLTIKGLFEKYPDCQIHGIDFSWQMYNKAIENNSELIKQGKVHLEFGDFSTYNFNNNELDLIYAINVIYFWDDLAPVFQKMNSLLKTGGRVILYMSDRDEIAKYKFSHDDVFNRYSLEYVMDEFKKAGFSSVNYILNAGFMRKAYFVTAVK